MVLDEEEPLFPTGAVLFDFEWVDANPGVEERGERHIVWRREGAVTRTVARGGDSQ
jgi:hypothetical protein